MNIKEIRKTYLMRKRIVFGLAAICFVSIFLFLFISSSYLAPAVGSIEVVPVYEMDFDTGKKKLRYQISFYEGFDWFNFQEKWTIVHPTFLDKELALEFISKIDKESN